MSLADLARQRVALTRQKQDLEATLRRVKKDLERLDPTVLEALLGDDVDRITVDGYTVAMTTQVYCSAADAEKAIALLDREGLADIAKRRPNASQLAAFVRECEREGEPLPDGFDEAFKVSRVSRVSVTATSRAKA